LIQRLARATRRSASVDLPLPVGPATKTKPQTSPSPYFPSVRPGVHWCGLAAARSSLRLSAVPSLGSGLPRLPTFATGGLEREATPLRAPLFPRLVVPKTCRPLRGARLRKRRSFRRPSQRPPQSAHPQRVVVRPARRRLPLVVRHRPKSRARRRSPQRMRSLRRIGLRVALPSVHHPKRVLAGVAAGGAGGGAGAASGLGAGAESGLASAV